MRRGRGKRRREGIIGGGDREQVFFVCFLYDTTLFFLSCARLALFFCVCVAWPLRPASLLRKTRITCTPTQHAPHWITNVRDSLVVVVLVLLLLLVVVMVLVL